MFVGREIELEALEKQSVSGHASFVAIRGRRRIGKSRLIEEFSKGFSKKFFFMGLPPDQGITSVEQREEFIQQMRTQGLPPIRNEDWSDIFLVLGQAAAKGKVLLVFDEIAWMGFKDPTFLGKLKNAWDQLFEKNNKLMLVVASSISSWIEKNILRSKGFFGRVDLTLTLRELSIEECSEFWGKQKQCVSAYEKLKVLGVTGGVPKYLRAIQPKLSAEENICDLCFKESGLLFNEFDSIFHDLFSRRSKLYKKIVKLLASHSCLTQTEICQGIGRRADRALSEYLYDLVTAGFIAVDFTWSIQSAKISNLRKYRLSDNYLRFYLKYIFPNKAQILKRKFEIQSVFDSLQWESIMGLQFENLVLYNSTLLYKKLGLKPSEVILEGPFFQKKGDRKKGCQIDLMFQTKASVLYICEIKFSKNPIGPSVIGDLEKKIYALAVPKHVSCRPVLIHVGGVQKEVVEADFFHKIIDWTQFVL